MLVLTQRTNRGRSSSVGDRARRTVLHDTSVPPPSSSDNSGRTEHKSLYSNGLLKFYIQKLGPENFRCADSSHKAFTHTVLSFLSVPGSSTSSSGTPLSTGSNSPGRFSFSDFSSAPASLRSSPMTSRQTAGAAPLPTLELEALPSVTCDAVKHVPPVLSLPSASHSNS